MSSPPPPARKVERSRAGGPGNDALRLNQMRTINN